MGILENFAFFLWKSASTGEAWDKSLQTEPTSPEFESKPMPITDNAGREVFWDDQGQPQNDGLALKIFKEDVCQNFSCQD